jgi:hypothetical protein
MNIRELRKPTLIEIPSNSIKTKKDAPLSWPKGNLKCDWNMMVLSHEDYILELERRKYIFNIVLIILLITPIIAVFVVLLSLGFSEFIVSLFLLPIFFIFALFMYFFVFKSTIKYAKDPNIRKEVKVGWGDIDRARAISSIKEFIAQNYSHYTFKYNDTLKKLLWNPEERYYLPNGLIVKTEYKTIEKRPAGWLAIEYLPNDWETALELQLDLDNYCYNKRIANIRNVKYHR